MYDYGVYEGAGSHAHTVCQNGHLTTASDHNALSYALAIIAQHVLFIVANGPGIVSSGHLSAPR